MTARATDRAASGWRALLPGSAIMAWSASKSEEALFQGAPGALEDRVDYRFRNGWVDTGDLPCRVALHQRQKTHAPACPDGPFTDVLFANDAGELDFSTFRYRPTLVQRAFQSRLRAARDGTARFRIETCGGVRIWIDGREAAVFEPFQRNQRSRSDVAFDIPAGDSLLTLALEDLHERDTQNFFSLVYVDGPPLQTCLPSPEDLPDVTATAEAFASLHFDKVFHETGPVHLFASAPVEQAIPITVEGPVQFPRGGIVSPEKPPVTIRVIDRAKPDTAIFTAQDAPAGCAQLSLSTEVGGIRLTRTVGTTVLHPPHRLEGDLAERKAAAATLIATGARFEPAVAMLLALRGEAPKRVEEILATVIPTIEDRHDCSDFSILPLLRLWRDASETLTDATRQRLEKAILGYRYWMTEPGNDVMWFWSENHVLCFHTAQLVAGRLFPEARFTNSGRTGRDLAEEARVRLHRWFDAIDANGLCEWNSAAYYPIDLLGLLTLHDMAPDLEDRSRRTLDRIFAMTALHTSGDVPAGCQGRCYEKELLAGPATELGSVAAIAFGLGCIPGYDRAAALFCVSGYEPPESLGVYVRPPQGAALEAQYRQGFGEAGRLQLWKSADVQLSTCESGEAGSKGHQVHVVDVQATAHPMARLWVNHPGDLNEWGDRRPSLLAGNHVMPHVAQHGPTALLIYALDRDWTNLPFTQLFATRHAFDAHERLNGWWVFRAGKSDVAVWCSATLASVQGSYAGSLWRAHAIRSAWVIDVRTPGEEPPAFRDRLAHARPTFDENSLTVETQAANATRLTASFGAEPRVNGSSKPRQHLPVEPFVGWNGGTMQHWRQNGTGT